MFKRSRPTSEWDGSDDAVMERVKRLAIESRAPSPSNNASTTSDSVEQENSAAAAAQKALAIYREQARLLRALHFERLDRAAQHLSTDGDISATNET